MSSDPSSPRSSSPLPPPPAPAPRALLDATRQGLCAVDLEGRITFVNRAACTLLGLTPESVPGQPIQHFVDLAQAQDPAAPRVRRSSDGWGQRQVVTLPRADGTPVTLAFVTVPLEERGQRVGAVVL